MNSQFWLIVSFLWSTLHDPFFFLCYWLLTNKLHWIKTKMPTQDRIKRIERIVLQHMVNHRTKALKEIRKEHSQ